jgi:tRNA uridine 5-carboxymethylaminomethyl modification enzyme
VLAKAGSTALDHPYRIAHVVQRPGVTLAALFEAAGVPSSDDSEAMLGVELELKYAGYFAREREAVERLRSLERRELPVDAPYLAMRSLSTEARQKLDRIRPATMAGAAAIPGVSQSDLQNLLLEISRTRPSGDMFAANAG